jgi:hypothetical protein
MGSDDGVRDAVPVVSEEGFDGLAGSRVRDSEVREELLKRNPR